MGVVNIGAAGGVPDAVTRGAVAVGNFDGVHAGHVDLVARLRRHAQALGGPAVAVTFDPHPGRLLAPERVTPLLTTLGRRAELLHAAGADHVAVLRVTRELLGLSPAEFFEAVLGKGLRARAVVEGFNFRFGRGRAGTVETLAALCAASGVVFEAAPPLLVGGAPASSSRVREALLAGDVAGAAVLLGRRYGIDGVVVTGARRGRTLNFPTANLDGVATLVPAEGVYAVRAGVAGRWHAAAANVGPNPTFGDAARKLEVHLLDFAGDLYGRNLSVEFVERLRPTRPFRGPAELVAQLRDDVARARELLGRDREGHA